MERVIAVIALLGAIGCAGSPFELDLSIHLGGDIDPGIASRITTFVFDVTGGEEFSQTLSLGRAPNETERIVYHPRQTTKSIDMTINATDGTNVLASGSTNVALGNGTTKADLTLYLVVAPPDLGVGDLSVDEDMTPPPDMTTPPDMTLACPVNALCYDFEPGDTLPSSSYGDQNCEVSADLAYHGAQSLHCTGTTSSYFVSQLGSGAGPMAVRAHIYSRGPNVANSNTKTATYLALTATTNTGLGAGDYSSEKLGFEYATGSTSTSAHSSPVADAPGWHCLELVYTPPTSGIAYIDGQEITGPITNVYMDNSSKVALNFGLVATSDPSVFWDFYLDDIVFSYGRIGCD